MIQSVYLKVKVFSHKHTNLEKVSNQFLVKLLNCKTATPLFNSRFQLNYMNYIWLTLVTTLYILTKTVPFTKALT